MLQMCIIIMMKGRGEGGGKERGKERGKVKVLEKGHTVLPLYLQNGVIYLTVLASLVILNIHTIEHYNENPAGI